MTVLDTDLTTETDAVLDARLMRLFRLHLEASKAGDGEAKAEAHRLTMLVLNEQARRRWA